MDFVCKTVHIMQLLEFQFLAKKLVQLEQFQKTKTEKKELIIANVFSVVTV